MLILCWNVAGLSTTANRIHSTYGNQNNVNGSNTKKPSTTAVLSDYMKRHGADIVCLQEHKIPLSQLSTRSEPLGCSHIDGYESFWSCCVDEKKKGLNGVVTYVKQGKVLSANSRPLKSSDLDDQGRCVMTDHGDFVLFNVYVPAGGGQPLSYKMKFLNALRRAMAEQRQSGKKVILVGDLNISHARLDQFWSDRVLHVNAICAACAADNHNNNNNNIDGSTTTLPSWKHELANAWSKIEAALETKKVVPTQTTNTLTNKSYSKYRMTIQVDGKTVFLGSHEATEGHCEYYYDLDACSYTCAETDEQIQVQEKNVVCLSIVAELLNKVAGIKWDEAKLKMISQTEANVNPLSPPRKWLDQVLTDDDMTDVFRHFYPNAEGRYTCWHQFTNKRYTNEGARIDYTLVDRPLLPFVQKGSVDSLRCACSGDEKKHDPDSEVAGLCAATANGGFQAVSFEGGGIVESTQETLDTQFGPPHTGMVYTPPSFSDHIAISLLLDDECLSKEELVLNEKDAMTRKAQPHKAQKSIASFFSANSTTGSENQVNGKTTLNRKIPTAVTKTISSKPKGIQAFFKAPSKPSGNGPAVTKVTKTTKHRLEKAKVSKGSILSHFQQK